MSVCRRTDASELATLPTGCIRPLQGFRQPVWFVEELSPDIPVGVEPPAHGPQPDRLWPHGTALDLLPRTRRRDGRVRLRPHRVRRGVRRPELVPPGIHENPPTA